MCIRDRGGFVEPLREHEGAIADSSTIVCGNPQLFEGFAEIVRSRD